jgi:hypothetical protein
MLPIGYGLVSHESFCSQQQGRPDVYPTDRVRLNLGIGVDLGNFELIILISLNARRSFVIYVVLRANIQINGNAVGSIEIQNPVNGQLC